MRTNDNEFTELRRLLALKRYEIPPPGYFQSFSTKVIARLETSEAASALPWWERWALVLRPAAVCASGIAMCSLLVGALIAAQSHDTQAAPFMALMGPQRDVFNAYDRESIPINLAEVPASLAPVLPGTSPFNQFISSAERSKFNVLLAGN